MRVKPRANSAAPQQFLVSAGFSTSPANPGAAEWRRIIAYKIGKYQIFA
jgi:hypothetical protein